jgi:protein O-mannosyl-transferase
MYVSLFFIFIFNLVLYQECWDNPFVLDDLTKIHQNTDLRGPFSLHSFVYNYGANKMHFRNDPSRPLVYMLYWISWQIGGNSPRPFHILNTVLHATAAVFIAVLTTLLCSLLFSQSSPIPGFVAGILFSTSPLMAGTVVYNFGLSDIVSTTFILLALILAMSRKVPSRTVIGVMAIIYICALGSKQAAIVLPGLLIVLDYFCGWIKDRSRRWRVYLPTVAISIIYVLVRWLYFGGIGDLEGRDELLPPLQYASTQGLMILKYIALTVLPFHLTVDHRYSPEQFETWQWALAWLTVIFLTMAALKMKRLSPTLRMVGIAWLLFVISVLPTSSIFPTVDLFVERRAYSAHPGLFIAAGVLLWRLFMRSNVWHYAVPIIVVMLTGVQTVYAIERVRVYASVEKLWQESLTEDPENPRALINLGVYYTSVKRYEEARAILEHLLILQPQNGAIHTKLAFIYHQKDYVHHDTERAWFYYQKGLELNPENIFAIYNAGVLQMERGQHAKAEEFFARAAQLSPQMGSAWLAAGQAALLQNKMQSAERYLKEAVAVDPNLVDAQKLLDKIAK